MERFGVDRRIKKWLGTHIEIECELAVIVGDYSHGLD